MIICGGCTCTCVIIITDGGCVLFESYRLSGYSQYKEKYQGHPDRALLFYPIPLSTYARIWSTAVRVDLLSVVYHEIASMPI